MFHPSQLEKKFGGEAENLDVFWPPKEISTEYGVEPHKIVKPSYDDSADVNLDDIDDSVQFNHDQPSSLILKKTIKIKNKLNPNLAREIEADEIVLELKENDSKVVIFDGDESVVPEISKNGKFD